MLLTPAKLKRTCDGNLLKLLRLASEKPSLGIWKTVSGGKIFKIIITAKNAWGLDKINFSTDQ